jgi:uncharacterized protein YprB with RNaseH-like and TPR domain
MLILDTEIFPNWFLLSMMDSETGKVRHFERTDAQQFDGKTVDAIMRKYLTGSFNGLNFDLPLIVAAIKGATPKTLKAICDAIIIKKQPVWRVMREHGLKLRQGKAA